MPFGNTCHLSVTSVTFRKQDNNKHMCLNLFVCCFVFLFCFVFVFLFFFLFFCFFCFVLLFFFFAGMGWGRGALYTVITGTAKSTKFFSKFSTKHLCKLHLV